ncbi:MAG: hypothetical protein RL368_456 [Pseudomonadota bacterium]|jgi:hypothetical protein
MLAGGAFFNIWERCCVLSHVGWVANGNPTQIRILPHITFFVSVGLTCANPTYGLLRLEHKAFVELENSGAFTQVRHGCDFKAPANSHRNVKLKAHYLSAT